MIGLVLMLQRRVGEHFFGRQVGLCWRAKYLGVIAASRRCPCDCCKTYFDTLDVFTIARRHGISIRLLPALKILAVDEHSPACNVVRFRRNECDCK